MAIYNRASTLPEAIASVFQQTYPNWELLLCDDGSTDETYQVAHAYAVQRPEQVILLKNAVNEGAAAARNRCLAAATGAYIAIMDSDDISLPTRLETEVAFLNQHPEYAVVGSAMIPFDETGDRGIRTMENEFSLHRLRSCMHATLMARKEVFDALGGYSVSPKLRRGEDLEFWFRFSAQTSYLTFNLSEPLYKVREDKKAYARRTVRDGWTITRIYWNGYRLLGYPKKSYFQALKPLVSALLPKSLMRSYHLHQDQITAQES